MAEADAFAADWSSMGSDCVPRSQHKLKAPVAVDRKASVAERFGGNARSLTAAVFDRLRDDILSCQLLPGDRLNIADLSQTLQVSPGAIREALSRLTSESLIVAEPQRGFTVTPISPADLVDLTRTRCQIEAQCLRRAIEVGDVAWETSVVAIHHTLSRTQPYALNDKKIVSEDWARAHKEFHEALVSACDSIWLLRMRRMLYLHSERYRRLSGPLNRQERKIDREHAEILEATLARDADRACRLLIRHIEATTRILLRLDLVPRGPKTDGNSQANRASR
jgi:DNA-binding GntR family transcriptional regulator